MSARQAEQFWAEMRSTAYLFQQSIYATPEKLAKLENELGDILGNRIINYPPTFRQLGIGPGTTYKDKRRFLALHESDRDEITDNQRKFITCMLNKAAQGRKANWSWRIVQEAEQKQKEKWYPFFVTLTVDPKMCCGQTHNFKGRHVSYQSVQEMWKSGREIRLYIRSLSKLVASLLKHPPPHKKAKNYKGTGVDYDYRPESDYVTYAAVLEHGKSQEHHHAHIMLWLREIPSHWKIDPNESRLRQYRTERECIPLRCYWPWCISEQKPALYFRTKGDIWSRLGHTTPIDKKTGQSIKINQVQAVGNYVTKYMQKGTKVWHHRMKCTRGLGLQRIQKAIDQMNLEEVKALSWKPQNAWQHHSVSLIHSVPQGLIRSMAKRKVFSILWENNSLDLKQLMKTNYGHYSEMLRSVKNGARPDRMPSDQFYDWVQQFLPEEKEYCSKKLYKAHEKLRFAFPRQIHKITPITIPGNQSGFTQCL